MLVIDYVSKLTYNMSLEVTKMRKDKLRMNELKKYEVIKELVDHRGNKKRASIKLGLSIRQIDRLIHIYNEKILLFFANI